MKIAVDCMSGDAGLKVTLPAAANFLAINQDAQLLLVGLTELIEPDLRSLKLLGHSQIQIVDAREVVLMDDSIEIALRKKKNSSMRVAANLLKEGLADAMVSSGNTGALMAISRYVLKTLDGIDRPAIASALPNRIGTSTTVLDLGANAECEPIHLLQFAQMGSVLVNSLEGKDNPTIGLLNIGAEAIKGSEIVKIAANLLRDEMHGVRNFYGNVEGHDIFCGTTDVVVCDGFVGNVALKVSEGLASMMAGVMHAEFTRSHWTKFIGLLAQPILRRFRAKVDHRRYNGAALVGLRNLVIKSHGNADIYAFFWALRRAYDGVKNQTIQRLIYAFKPKGNT